MSAVTRLAHALGRADQPDAAGVFLRRDDAGLYKQARQADARAANDMSLGSLDGQLVVIKGNFALKNLPTTAGSVSFIAPAEPADAPLVQQLRSCGAIPMGHANLSEFAYSGLGLNPHFGTPRNALDANLAPGGSSSGCASAIALGIADLAIGTDSSGSTRVPAAYQGIYGYRPTMGRYDASGILPLAPSLDTPGPMARDLSGIRLLDTALAQAERDTPSAEPSHIVVPDRNSLGAIAPAISALLYEAIRRLRAAGWHVDVRPVKALEQVRSTFERYGTLVAAEAPSILSRWTALDQPALDPNVRRRLQAALPANADNTRQLHAMRAALKDDLSEDLNSGFVLMPTVPQPPPRLADIATNPERFARENARALSLTMPLAFLDMPSLAMPAGPKLPGYSLTLAAASGRDGALLATAEAMSPLLCDMRTELL